MSFQRDVAFADDVGQTYGEYCSTFHSETGQVLAYLFKQNGGLVAHVLFPTGLKPEDVTDPYASELHEYAREQGFENKLRIIYSE
jgi:hypothetical protein